MSAGRAAAHAVSQTMCRGSREAADTVLQGGRVCARTTAVLDITETIVLLLASLGLLLWRICVTNPPAGAVDSRVGRTCDEGASLIFRSGSQRRELTLNPTPSAGAADERAGRGCGESAARWPREARRRPPAQAAQVRDAAHRKGSFTLRDPGARGPRRPRRRRRPQ
jgi:hypothetical protein